MRRAVLDLNSERRVWRITDDVIRRVRTAFGDDWEVRPVSAKVSSDGDGSGASAEALELVAAAEVYAGWGISAPVLDAARELQWVHTASAGVRGSITPALSKSGVVFTNSRGIHAEPMADWVLAAIGYCTRGFHLMVAAQRTGRWAKSDFTDGGFRPRELAGLRVGLVGLGGIGNAVARRCLAHDMSVAAVRRRVDAAPVPGVDWVGSGADVASLACQSDVLVICAAHTGETDRLVGREVLAAMPDGGYVINVARGEILDQMALIRELDSGRLGGAVLDVFEGEPIPPGDPLWAHPRVLVSPHVSAVTDRFWDREGDLLCENVRRYLAGDALLNVVDLDLGY
ncbi:MAG: D-2-hydroxyacid dehydrogenase [Gemmatimonadales bacterium]